MEEEIVNTGVNDEEVNVSDSSSDEEVDLENMDADQLREAYKKKEEANKKLVQHLRNKEAKRQSIEEAVKPSQEDPKEEDKDTLTIVREEAKRVVQQEHRQARISEFSEGSTDWLKSQAWAEDINKSDQLYGSFAKELKRLTDSKEVRSQQDFRKLMRLAVVNVTGKADALLEQSADEEIIKDKQQSSGYRPSVSQNMPSYSGFSAADRVIIDRMNARRVKQGLKPLKPSEIIKK